MNYNNIFTEYYEKILNFCYVKTGSRELAEECAQEVFLALAKKMHILRLDTNVAAWLYGAAKKEIKRCFRKNKISCISLDELEEIPQDSEGFDGRFDDILTDDEYSILEKFYVKGEDISKLAAEYSLSESAMYQRIHRLKQKIIDNSDKLHNYLKE